MLSAPPFPNAPDRRRLAAIVFTDVAGFSARMQVEEARALQLLERDFAAMREFSARHSGSVLKSMGDGLLIYFTSAVHAVTWAVAIQRHLADAARAAPAAEALRHRVGIHVGDVFVKADDVMGDGVNIAARVQAEAPPGGICISQTVYELVKNKLELHVIRLEPRKLKNIRENVPMYHVLLQAPGTAGPSTPPMRAPALAPQRPGPVYQPPPPPPRRLGLPLALGLVAVVGAGTVYLIREYGRTERQRADFQQASQNLETALATAGQTPAPAAPAAGTPPVPAGPDYLALLAQPAAREPAVLAEATRAIPALEAWLHVELLRYTSQRPLAVANLRESRTLLRLYTNHNRELVFVEGRAERVREWTSLRPDQQGAIILGVLQSPTAPAPADARRGAEAFAFVHQLPEMIEPLQRLRGGR